MRTIPIRARWALWCAALVTATGAIVVVIVLGITSRLLRDRAGEALGVPPPGQPPATVPAPGRPERLGAGARVTEDVIADVRVLGAVTVSLLAICSLGVGWAAAGLMVRPVKEVTRVANEVAGGRFGERIELNGPQDELRELGSTFNHMLDRLDTAFAANRTFVADASHELRTPLAVTLTELEVALDDEHASAGELREALAAAAASTARTTSLVNSLLALSRSEVLTDVADHDLAAAIDRSLQTHPVGNRDLQVMTVPAMVRGDPILIDRLVDNLIENAVRYTPEGGRIVVACATEGGRPVLSVDNDGPHMNDEDVTAAFRRFDRRHARDADGGTGLGLAIVASIARTHDAELHARPRPTGGLSVTVRFAGP